ncbi:MAG: D-2-hydroxyacid dehydrogenase [Chloroflexota bacterium]
MRLILDAEIRPETVERLRALSADLDVVDVTGDATFDPRRLRDPEVEVIVGSRPPDDLGGVPKLRWIQVRSAGVDHLAADPPWRHRIALTNARGVYAVPMGEYVSGMVLRVHQPMEAWRADQAAHRWPEGTPPLVSIVRGKTAVIAGYGSIGREVARQLSALGLRIIAVKPRPEIRVDTSFRVPGTGDPHGSIPERIVGDGELAAVASEADVLVVTMPLTDATRGIISRTVIAALPERAWFINIARGALVDEVALLEALRERRLAGAVLDVFGEEPLPPDSPWWDVPNVIVTPHASGHTLRFFDELVIENVRRYLAGEPLLNPVDPERGY